MRKNIIFVLLLIIPVMGYARIYGDSVNMVTPMITSEFEKFDTDYYEKIKIQNMSVGVDTLQDGTYIVMGEDSNGKSYSETRKNQYFRICKIYYGNGNIEEKGLCFIYGGKFKKGVWYSYDEQGNLTDSIDYDEPYKFTFEQVLDFARKEGIEYKKFDMENKPSGLGRYTELYRNFDDYHKRYEWFICHWNQQHGQMEEITLDGVTGEILKREFTDYLPR